MIKSQTLPSFRPSAAKKSCLKRQGSLLGKKKMRKRMQQLKVLLMLSMIKAYKKQYIFRIDYNDLAINKSTFTFEQYTFKCFQSLEKKLQAFIRQLHSNKENNGIINLKSKMDYSEFGQSIQPSGKESIRQLKNKKNKSQMINRCEHQIKQFQKLNVLIDKLSQCNIVNKSLEYLNVLKSIMGNLRSVIYKYFKKLKSIDEGNARKMAGIKLYCHNIYEIFMQICQIMRTTVDKDQNYQRYESRFDKIEVNVNKQEDIVKHFQILLFYFNQITQLKRLYQISSKIAQIGQNNPSIINKLIKFIIRLRHMLGYLTKEIINFNAIDKQKQTVFAFSVNEKDVWKTIYQKKYQSNSYKNRLRLQ